MTWAFRKAALIPWLACACAADPLLPSTHFGQPVAVPLPAGQLACVVGAEGAYFLGHNGEVRWMATPTSPAAVFRVGPGATHLSVGKSEMALSCGDEIRCFSKVGFPTRRLACPAAGPTLQVDLNDDGQQELVAISQGQLLIFAGNSPTVIDAGRIPLALAAGDPNGDGKMDLAVACAGDSRIVVWQNMGNLNFRQGSSLPSPYPVALACADMDGDGKSEWISADRATGRLRLGQTELELDTPLSALQVTDINGDKLPDLVVTAPDKGLIYLLGGGLDKPGTVPCPGALWGATWGTDLLVGSLHSVQRAPAEPAPLSTTLGYQVSRFLPMEGGRLLALGSHGSSWIGPGLQVQAGDLVVGGDLGVNAVSGDLNGDGRNDLVIGGSPCTVRLNLGQGHFGPATKLAYSGYHVAVEDWDGNGRAEIALCPAKEERVVFLGDDAAYTQKASVALANTAWGCHRGDFDGDGRPDLLVPLSLTSNFYWLPKGQGPARALPGPNYWWNGGQLQCPDLNGDGRSELVYFGQGEVTVLPNLGAKLSLEKPLHLAFENPKAPVQRSWSHGDAGLVADFNLDGRPDLAVLDFTRDQVGLRLNLGNLRFGPLCSLATGQQPMALGSVDLNGDRKPDLVIGNELHDDLSIWLNQTRPGSATCEFGTQ